MHDTFNLSASESPRGHLHTPGRKALKTAGQRLGWKVATHYEKAGGRLIAYDARDCPPHVQAAMNRHAAEAMGELLK